MGVIHLITVRDCVLLRLGLRFCEEFCISGSYLHLGHILSEMSNDMLDCFPEPLLGGV